MRSATLSWLVSISLVAVAACHSKDKSRPAVVHTTTRVAAQPLAPPMPTPAQKLAQHLSSLPHEVLDPKPRLPAPPSSEAPRLSARDGDATIDFALAHTSVVARVTGNIARVEVTQRYQNPSNKRLEAVYAFPLPENAAVTDMMFRIGNRVVASEVRKKNEARAVYEQAKQEGHTAALTVEERPNIFTQSVANIPPGESVEVLIRYVHEVKFDDGRYQFHFPTTIGPRYSPASVRDVKRISPPIVAPGLHSQNRLDMVVQLHPAAAFADIASASHRVMSGVDDAAGDRLIALTGDELPNQDFLLSYRPAQKEPDARIVTARDHGEDYLMLFVQPPADVAPAMVRPKEMVFLVDKSGSMMGAPIDTAKRVIATALAKMGPRDTFQLIAFDSSTESMSPVALPSTPENVAAATRWLQGLSGGGGTEMMAGISAALDLPSDPERLRMVVFCTDGYIGNEKEIIDHIATSRGSARVFGFGIGSSVNRYLIEGVARAGRGAAEIVRADEPVDAAVARLYKRLDRPVLTDVNLAFDGLEARALEPSRLPDLFAGQPLVVVGKYRATKPNATVTLTGKLGTRPFTRTLPVTLAAEGHVPILGTLWARRRIEELSDGNPNGNAADAEGEIVALALKFKLITAFTSFVAVARQLKVDTNVPLVELMVPGELPEGMSYKGIFGDAPLGEIDTQAEITPARIKPGDPELRVRAPSTAQVRVQLPWARRPLRAMWDAPSGEFVARFLVPAGWPDGSFDARVSIELGRGAVEERTVELHVDTQPAAIAVVSLPEHAQPGAPMTLTLKPALPLSTLVAAVAAERAGGLGDALRSATDVKDVLVRAPWGEVARGKMEGALGLYTVTLHPPRTVAAGRVQLELAASDTAGNVSRRVVSVTLESAGQRSFAGATLGLLLCLLSCGLAGVGFARGRRA